MNIKMFCSGLILTLLSTVAVSETLLVEVFVKDGVHQVEQVYVVAGDFVEVSEEPGENMLRVSLWRGDFLMDSILVQEPKVVRSPLNQNGLISEHRIFPVSESVYHLRIPANLNVNRMTIVKDREEYRSMPSDTKNAVDLLVDYYL